MPRLQGTSQLLTQPLYDTMQLAAAANKTYRFFTVPIGGILVGSTLKDFQHTNVVQNSVLEKGIQFEINGLSMYVNEIASGGGRATFADLQVLQGGYMDLKLGQVSFLKLPTAMVPSGGAELVYTSNIAAAATEYHVNRGISALSNRFMLDNPVMIDDQEAITVDLAVPGTIAAVTDVTLVLWGNMIRPVR